MKPSGIKPVNDVLYVGSSLFWLLSYVLAFLLIKRSAADGRRIAIKLALAYLAGGGFTLYLLPAFTGAHYDYFDVGFLNNGKLEFPPMDFRFITNHLGLAVCAGSVLANLILEKYKIIWISVVGFLMPPLGEVIFRFPRWQITFEQLSGNDTRKTQSSLLPEIIASIGPSLIASVFLVVSVAILSRRITNDDHAVSENA